MGDFSFLFTDGTEITEKQLAAAAILSDGSRLRISKKQPKPFDSGVSLTQFNSLIDLLSLIGCPACYHKGSYYGVSSPCKSIYSILPKTRTSKGPMKIVRVNECSSYPG